MTLDKVAELANQLSPLDQVRLIERITPQIESALISKAAPRESLHGIFAHLGPAPSEEDIAEIRKEMWANFPREDIA